MADGFSRVVLERGSEALGTFSHNATFSFGALIWSLVSAGFWGNILAEDLHVFFLQAKQTQIVVICFESFLHYSKGTS